MSQQNSSEKNENMNNHSSHHSGSSHHGSSSHSGSSHHGSSSHSGSSHHGSSSHSGSSHHGSSSHSGSSHHGSSSHSGSSHRSSSSHSGSSHRSSSHHSGSSGNSSKSKRDYNYYSEASEEEKREADKKIKKLGEIFDNKPKSNSFFDEDEDDFDYEDDFDEFNEISSKLSEEEIVKRLEKNKKYESKKAKKRNKKLKKKKHKVLRIIAGILLFFLLLILIAAITLLIMINKGKKDMLDYSDTDIRVIDEAESDDDGKTVRYNGKIYRLNENITSIACLGIDKNEIYKNVVNGKAGQADTIIVVAFDTETGNATLIPIPRDTIAEIDVYADNGSFQRVEKTQICLAYAYGSDPESSCENVVSSVQKVIFGLPIHSYAALDLAGIGPMNDSIGGVTVTPPDSFEDIFIEGQPIHLEGEMAMRFVRSRDTTKVDSNLTRMKHQQLYIREFTSTAVSQIRHKPSMITDLYNKASDYSYSDMTLSDVSFVASRFISKGTGNFETVPVPGKMIASKEDGFSEYYIDEKGFYEVILSVYYDEIGTY